MVSESKSSRQLPGYRQASSGKRCQHKFTVGKCTSSYSVNVSPKIKLTFTTSKSESDIFSIMRVLDVVLSFLGFGFFLLGTDDDDSLLLLDDSCNEAFISLISDGTMEPTPVPQCSYTYIRNQLPTSWPVPLS